MGSLMAGWNAPTLDPDAARLERNRSLTREEIVSFWRYHGMKSTGRSDSSNSQGGHDQHRDQGSSSMGSEGYAAHGSGDKKPTDWQQLERSSNTCPGGGGGAAAAAAADLAKGKKAGDWWTRSNWAFLNEPPQDDLGESHSHHKYAPQFHVAEIAATNKHAAAA